MKKAFTLAEVLITLTIIGVVSVLTIPNIISNYQNKVLSTQLKKAYAEIAQAGALAITTEEAMEFKDTVAYNNQEFLNKYFKKTKDCGYGEEAFYECFASTYKKDGDVYDLSDEAINGHSISTKSGYSLTLNNNAKGVLDINGKKAPNTFGKDAFSVSIGKDGSITTSYDVTLDEISQNNWEIE